MLCDRSKPFCYSCTSKSFDFFSTSSCRPWEPRWSKERMESSEQEDAMVLWYACPCCPHFAGGETEPQNKKMIVHDLVIRTLIYWSSLHSQAHQHATEVMDNYTIWSDITWNQQSNAVGGQQRPWFISFPWLCSVDELKMYMDAMIESSNTRFPWYLFELKCSKLVI